MIVETGTNGFVITFTDDEMEIMNWVSSTYGNNEFTAMIDRFIIQRKAQMEESKKNELWANVKDHPDLIDSVQAEAASRIPNVKSISR